MIFLVTGGAGFIGSHIVERLLTDGHKVRVLDDFSTGKRSNLPDHPQLEIVEGDVGDYSVVAEVMDGVDRVFHEAAIASVPKTVEDPLASQRVNYQGTLHVLEAARQAGVGRVVFAASAAAYGDESPQPNREDMAVNPLSPYAVDKVASEHVCRVYQQHYGLETVCLRYFNVFGPRQDPSSPYSGVISIFVDSVQQGRQPTIYGDGEQTRDFVYVADVVEANMHAASAPGAAGRVFNIGTGDTITLNHLLTAVGEVCGRPVRAKYGPPRPGDIRHSCADNSAAVHALEWRPEVDLREGLRRLIAYQMG